MQFTPAKLVPAKAESRGRNDKFFISDNNKSHSHTKPIPCKNRNRNPQKNLMFFKDITLIAKRKAWMFI